jgi:hypothetical protein
LVFPSTPYVFSLIQSNAIMIFLVYEAQRLIDTMAQ